MNTNTVESDYTKNASEVLKAMNVKFTATFLKHDYHFQDDKEPRDIFKCTFKRKEKSNQRSLAGFKDSFSITFGQSISDSTGTGSNPPRAYDVLACIEKYQPENFEDFCSEFGYNEQPLSNYPKVKKIYAAVCKEFKKVSSFFTSEELEQLQEIQ